jgi:hypothetical protein
MKIRIAFFMCLLFTGKDLIAQIAEKAEDIFPLLVG